MGRRRIAYAFNYDAPTAGLPRQTTTTMGLLQGPLCGATRMVHRPPKRATFHHPPKWATSLMEKEAYESYEYLQENNEDNEENQFIVVQDDGTILSVNRPIQYVTQVQDVKEALDHAQANIVYDVTPQQFYVNVDNSSELVSVTDQFILPEGENNMYANSFLIQAVENDEEEQMEQDGAVQPKEEVDNNACVEVSVELDNAENKTNGDCTEITLSDDQYQLLEQKGWILLETSDKIYLLDTLGLHDITADKKLIEKLRHESQIDLNEETSTNKGENVEVTYENCEENYETTEVEEQTDYIFEEEVEHQEETVTHFNSKEEDSDNDNGHLSSKHFPHDYVKLNSVRDTSYRREGEALRIKTKFSFKDIPPEIVLGRTVHGKKLVASVKTEKQNLRSALTNKAVGEKFQRVSDEDSVEHLKNDTGLDDAKFDSLLQENLWSNADRCSKKDVTAAEIVVEQLLRVPAFKPTILERRLLVTKVVIEEHKTNQLYTETVPTLVTGRVIRNDNKLNFVYIPDLLRRSLRNVQGSRKVNEDNYLHIHIREMKGIDGITRISITLNKRNIPLNSLADNARNKQNMVFACSACAAVYKTEEGLKLHQETECMEIDDLLTIDADNTSNSYSVVQTGKDKQYMCNQCHSIFTKLSNCQKHIKTHFNQDNVTDSEETGNKKPEGIFKCKMCPGTYLHAATLSKHIVTKHIKIKAK
ncbi:unnamed protein product, partial [Brenthis ino]